MTNAILDSKLTVALIATSEEVAADVRDGRAESIALFGPLDEVQREQLATDAWTIGLRALQNAHSSAQDSKLEDIGKRLLADIDRRFQSHVELQHTTITTVLARYFDPRDGQVSQRLAAFVQDGGELTRLLDDYLAPQNSVLAQALAEQVGENSPLVRKLSPTDTDGLPNQLGGLLRNFVEESSATMIRSLDPLDENGPIGRFLRGLREELKSAHEDREAQLAAALAALDANDESSLLSRLVRETERARHEVNIALNPNSPDSAMALIKNALSKQLEEHATVQLDLAKANEERQARFEKEVREALARIETKRTHDGITTRGGFDFEDAVAGFVRSATQGAPCVFDVTGATTGVGRCKKGDAVLRFTAESAFEGATVVFEAKRDSSYTVQKALDELDAARKNRDAQAGVFVMARSHASDVFPRFARYGNNVLVVWDEQDSASDPYLHSAVLLGMALVSRSHTAGSQEDIAALRDIESRIDAELTRLDKMEKSCETIRKNAENIEDEVRKARKGLDLMLRKAQGTLAALRVEITDEAAEVASPIGLSNGSMESAARSLRAGVDAA